MVLNLEAKMSIEPVIEGGLVDIACCLELGGEPVRVVISVHGDLSVSPTQTGCFPGT